MFLQEYALLNKSLEGHFLCTDCSLEKGHKKRSDHEPNHFHFLFLTKPFQNHEMFHLTESLHINL